MICGYQESHFADLLSALFQNNHIIMIFQPNVGPPVASFQRIPKFDGGVGLHQGKRSALRESKSRSPVISSLRELRGGRSGNRRPHSDREGRSGPVRQAPGRCRSRRFHPPSPPEATVSENRPATRGAPPILCCAPGPKNLRHRT